MRVQLKPLTLGVGLLGAITFAACSGGTSGDQNNRGPFQVLLVSTGSGQVFPYRITELDAFGVPGTKVIDITSVEEDLRPNLLATNGIMPQGVWPTTATLPGGGAGNQFLQITFSHDLKISSLLSDQATALATSGLTGAVQILVYDPVTEVQAFVQGRAFVGGFTYYDDPATPALDLKLVRAVQADKDGNVSVRDARATGFPIGFTGDEALVSAKTLTFIPDVDGDLTTLETFPAGKVIRILVTSSVQDYRDKPLVQEVSTATTVGSDTIAPQVLGFSLNKPQITPGNNQIGVDPTTSIQINFSKPVQPYDVGQLFDVRNLSPELRGVTLNVTVSNQTYPVTYYGDPRNASDFTTYIVKPAYFFPGEVPVQVSVNNTINSISGVPVGNVITTSFQTGTGPGIVNAPVAPEAIYVGRGGSSAGLSVIDCNGFGQGTGDVGDTYPSRFRYNPNLGQPGAQPQLAPGTSNMDAGGAGIFTLTRDTNLSTLLLDRSSVLGIDEIMIGQPLDKVFNNESINPNAMRANQLNPLLIAVMWGNTISIAPHPNPPRLRFPPPNPAENIHADEPTMTSSGPPWITPYIGIMTNHPPVGPCTPSPLNLLTEGDPFSNEKTRLGIYGGVLPGIFYGPQPPPGTPQPPTPYCPYMSRQQIGHFLYVLDRKRRQVLVVNSNRMQVMETIRLSDPYSMALSPNLRRLAVTNFAAGTVTFIDTDPQSTSFHTIVGETKVGDGPTELAWQPEGEDLLVVNTVGGSMSLIGGADLALRKTVTAHLNSPLDVKTAPRQNGFGFATGIYFAYVLNGNGTVAVFESGPDGVNGIGFDDMVGIPEQATFRNARKMLADPGAQASAVYIAHTDDSGLGQVSHLELTSSLAGPLPIDANQGGFILPPTFRQRVWSVNQRFGGVSPTTPVKSRLSGDTPVDLALDDMFNYGGLPDIQSNQISNLTYADHSGRGMLKAGLVPATFPRFMFVALGDRGKIDVVELDTGSVIHTIDCPGVQTLAHYWRQ